MIVVMKQMVMDSPAEGINSTPTPKRKSIPPGRGKFKMSSKLPEGIGSSR